MKKLLYIFLLLPLISLAQTTTQNYVKTLIYKGATTSSSEAMANVGVTYFDGLGRPIQQIAGKQSGDGKDIITHIEYDAYGRQTKQYLPYAATTNNLAFDASAQSNTVAFYNTATYQNTSNPWNETFFEASPLNRVLKQGSPGTPWKVNTNDDLDRTVKFAYLTNTDNDGVKKLTAIAGTISNGAYDVTFVNGGVYAEGKLYKTITQDENKNTAIYRGDTGMQNKLNTTEEYKDSEGRVILKRTFVSSVDAFGMPGVGNLDTYYVYDQFGNLTYVLPPKAAGSLTDVEKLSYQYKYDIRNRLVEKKLPGKAWEFLVYDKLDRIVANGPIVNPWGGNEAATGWMITQYDAFGRVAFTGWGPATGINPALRKTMQDKTYTWTAKTTTAIIIDNISVYYTNSLPTDLQTGFKLLTINYYDNYVFPGAPAPPTTSTQIEGQNVLVNCKGLLTGTWVRALTSQGQSMRELSYTYYDKKGRPISTRVTNYLGGYTQTDHKLDFDGTLVYSITKHKRVSADTELVTRDEYTYDAQDRLQMQTHRIGELPLQLMAANTYDPIGRIIRKAVGNTVSSPLQRVDYSYNVRGWLTGINDIYDLGAVNIGNVQPQDLFAFKINYNGMVEQTINGAVKAQYNGNISEISWRTASDNIQRRYGFKYDEVGRMLDAYYQIPQSTTPVRNSYNEHVTYDSNGNIKTMIRNGNEDNVTFVQEIDDLTYSYDGNRLMKVTDSTNSPLGFKDGNQGSTDDYMYDAYGNMVIDRNKGINTAITYNHLNLPVTIVINNGTQNNGTISYLYDAVGARLKKTVTNNSTNPPTVTITDYLGGYQYVNAVLEFFPTSEGYVKHTKVGTTSNYNYVFQYKDHLGNNRVSYTVDANDNNVLKILEEDHYYPFGLKHSGYSSLQRMLKGSEGTGVVIVPVINPGDATYKYMYGSKELQDELSLNNYDFGARNYDPAIGRWMNIDPLAETSRRWTPYAYAYNNPIRFIDPDGMEGMDVLDENDLETIVDMGYYSREKGSIGSAISYSGADVRLSKSGKAKFALAAALDALNETLSAIPSEGNAPKRHLNATDVKKVYDAYPDPRNVDPDKLYSLIGGDLEKHYRKIMETGTEDEKSYWINTCASRLSYALNIAGLFIPSGNAYQTWKGANDLNYIVSSQLMFNYLDATYYQNKYSPIPTSSSTQINWGIIAFKDGNRINHVDVIWNQMPGGNWHQWDYYYLFAN